MNSRITAFLTYSTILAMLPAVGVSGRTMYVDYKAPGAGTGNDWSNAYTSVQDALANAIPGDRVHVARGVYGPPYGQSGGPAIFTLVDGTVLAGGYAGWGKGDPDARDVHNFATILTGGSTTDPDHLPPAEMCQCCSVIESLGVGPDTILDGFVITGGDQCLGSDRAGGGGLYNAGGSPEVKNCLFLGNRADSGGGMYSSGGSPRLVNCIFAGNTAMGNGGAFYAESGDCSLVNCTIADNSAGLDCGGVASAAGGAVSLNSCILWGNSGTAGPGSSWQLQGQNALANYSCIQGTDHAGGIGNISADPLFAAAADRDYHLRSRKGRFLPVSQWNVAGIWVMDEVTSPCIDAGDPSADSQLESTPSGGRVNMGAWGNTPQASASPGAITGDFNLDGTVDLDDMASLAEVWQHQSTWRMASAPTLMAHWTMEGVRSPMAGDFPESRSYIAVGTPVPAAGKTGGALQFSGESYLDCGADPVFSMPGSMTVSAWVMPTDDRNEPMHAVSKGQSWMLGIVSRRGAFGLGPAGSPAASTVTGSGIMDGEKWYHLAGVYDADAGHIRMYVDGVLESQLPISAWLVADTSRVWVGGNSGPVKNWWHGRIDEVRIYNYALDQTHIGLLFTGQRRYHVDRENGSNGNSGLSRQKALADIQSAIDKAVDGDTVLVWPGNYAVNQLDFQGKAITVCSASDPAILQAPNDIAVLFTLGEQADSVLRNFVIRNSGVAVWIDGSSPTINHVTVVNNRYGIDIYDNSSPTITNSIFWNNSHGDVSVEGTINSQPSVRYCCLERPFAGNGNISVDPLLADPSRGDYHLMSRNGRFAAGQEFSSQGTTLWVRDEQTSPCIDAADPVLFPGAETCPNGNRRNMGACGGMAMASRGDYQPRPDINCDGLVNMVDLAYMASNWLKTGGVAAYSSKGGTEDVFTSRRQE